MKFKIGDPVRVMDFSELEHIHQFKSLRENVPIRHFSLRMVMYFGSIGCVTDCTRQPDGTEVYRISNDKGENLWDGALLRIE